MKKTKESEQLAIQGSEETEILNRLADRVERAVQTIAELRKEREQLRSRLNDVEGELKGLEESSTRLVEAEEEVTRFREEREVIRERIERMLENLESLDEAEVGA